MAKPNETKPQIDKFKDAARELGTDDREEAFNERLRKVAKTDAEAWPPSARPKPQKKPRVPSK